MIYMGIVGLMLIFVWGMVDVVGLGVVGVVGILCCVIVVGIGV